MTTARHITAGVLFTLGAAVVLRGNALAWLACLGIWAAAFCLLLPDGMTTVRRTAVAVLFVLGVAPLLLLNVTPFNNAIACLSFWTLALLLLLPDGRISYVLFVLILAIAALLPDKLERQRKSDAMRERAKQWAAEAEREMTRQPR